MQSELSTAAETLFSEVQLLLRIAHSNGSLLSVRDLSDLTQTRLNEEQIAALWPSVQSLSEKFELKNGYLFERGVWNGIDSPTLLQREFERNARADAYISFAKEFGELCKRGTSLLAVSGSTAYHSTGPADDLDFFCVSKPDELWIFLTKALLLARFLRLVRREAPRICFSYAVDQTFAEKEFAYSSDPLFARDALTTVIIHGPIFYQRLLNRSPWIADRFPQLFKNRKKAVGMNEKDFEHPAPSQTRKFANNLLFMIVGKYILAKSRLLNRSLLRRRRGRDLFNVRIGPDHCVFESVRYSRLRVLYSQFGRTGSETGPSAPVK